MKNKKKHYVVIVGARPNFVKAAAFFMGSRNNPHILFTLIHTGQHFDDNMSRIFFEDMQIPKPKINFNISGENHSEKIGKMFNYLKRYLEKKKITGVIVFGDINSTLAGAIAAVKNKHRLIHIEAGLRSHDRRMPEEMNRVIVDHLSDLLFISEESARGNLLKEGILSEKIVHSGNLMIESLIVFSGQIDKSDILSKLKLKKKSFVVSTIHRVENTDDKKILKKLLILLNDINKKFPVVMSLHPGTRNKIKSFKLGFLIRNLTIIEPLGYFDFLKLVKESMGVVTDSGGIQEETTHMKIPCVTLRDNTERPVTITHGTNKLYPIASINRKSSKDILKYLGKHKVLKNIKFWDDKVSGRIFKYL